MTDSEFDELLNQAQTMTDEQLKNQITSLTTLTSDEIKALAPTAESMVQLLQFIKIVRSAADFNDKKARLLNGIDAFANIIFSLAGKAIGSVAG